MSNLIILLTNLDFRNKFVVTIFDGNHKIINVQKVQKKLVEKINFNY